MPQASVLRGAQQARSKFNHDHTHDTTIGVDYLTPILNFAVLPSDTISVEATSTGFFLPPNKHVMMTNMYLKTYSFFCPYRILLNSWRSFLGEVSSPNDKPLAALPSIELNTTVEPCSLADYLGIPPANYATIAQADRPKVSFFPFLAYNLIYNDWFRDENLQTSVPFAFDRTTDAPYSEISKFYKLLKALKKKDYFTSCLPWVQKFEPGGFKLSGVVQIDPIVYQNGKAAYPHFYTDKGAYSGLKSAYIGVDSQAPPDSNLSLYSEPKNGYYLSWAKGKNTIGASLTGLQVDLSKSDQSVNINQLRQAAALQQFNELAGLAGTRYNEILLANFGVTPYDITIDRPQFLALSSKLLFSDSTPQTSATSGSNYQGDLTSRTYIQPSVHKFTNTFKEHGIILTLACVVPDILYQQGLSAFFTKHTKFDFAWPTFCGLGDQPVYDREIFSMSPKPTTIFGYQQRYAEYMMTNNSISGYLRSDVTGSLDSLHLAQDFASTPKLNGAFVDYGTPMSRVLAYSTSFQDILLSNYFKIDTVRPISSRQLPGLHRI